MIRDVYECQSIVNYYREVLTLASLVNNSSIFIFYKQWREMSKLQTFYFEYESTKHNVCYSPSNEFQDERMKLEVGHLNFNIFCQASQSIVPIKNNN